MNKKVLFVTTAFPPRQGSGVARVMRVCHKFPDIDYSPVVLTMAPVGYEKYPGVEELGIVGEIVRSPYIPFDGSLFGGFRSAKKTSSGLTQKTSSRKTESFLRRLIKKVYQYFEFPDSAQTWIRGAVEAGSVYLERNEVSVIYSTSPGVSAHFVASELARKTGLPWVMEYRDLWVGNPWNLAYSWWRYKIDGRFEKSFAQQASRIITVSEGSQKILETRYPFVKGRVAVVSNGFDPSEYPQPVHESRGLPLTLLHTGTFYKGRRDITGLYQAITAISNNKPDFQNRLRLQIAGDFEKYALRQAAKLGVSDYIDDQGVLSTQEALKLQTSADILLLIEAAEDSEWVYSNLPGKLYEYLGANKPILALINPASMLAQKIRETRTGVVIHPQDWKSIAEYLESMVDVLQRSGSIPFEANQMEVEQYNWANIIKKIGTVLNEIA